MGDNSLTDIAGDSLVTEDQINQYKEALSGDLLPRGSNGQPNDGISSLGSNTYRWSSLYAKQLQVDELEIAVGNAQALSEERINRLYDLLTIQDQQVLQIFRGYGNYPDLIEEDIYTAPSFLSGETKMRAIMSCGLSFTDAISTNSGLETGYGLRIIINNDVVGHFLWTDKPDRNNSFGKMDKVLAWIPNTSNGDVLEATGMGASGDGLVGRIFTQNISGGVARAVVYGAVTITMGVLGSGQKIKLQPIKDDQPIDELDNFRFDSAICFC